MAVLDAPEQEHASETARQPRGSAAPKRTMRREFTEFDDEQDELDDDGRGSARRRQPSCCAGQDNAQRLF